MWPLVAYSNYFEIVSTVTFMDSQTELISGRFLYKTVILYHYIFIHDYTTYNICSAWFLDIVISTCYSYFFILLFLICSNNARPIGWIFNWRISVLYGKKSTVAV